MKQGKRLIRNTLLAVLGITALLPAASRLYAAVVDQNTPAWLRGIASLGLVVMDRRGATPALEDMNLDDAVRPGFTRVSVVGGGSVEVVAAPQHRVSGSGRGGERVDAKAMRGADGLLMLRAEPEGEGAVLRIEAPTLESVHAKDAAQLMLRGLELSEMTLTTEGVSRVLLEDMRIGRLELRAQTPVLVEADNATIAAGLNVEVIGAITIHGAGEQTLNLDGRGGRFSLTMQNGAIGVSSRK